MIGPDKSRDQPPLLNSLASKKTTLPDDLEAAAVYLTASAEADFVRGEQRRPYGSIGNTGEQNKKQQLQMQVSGKEVGRAVLRLNKGSTPTRTALRRRNRQRKGWL
jgi:hypothetical protein